MEEKTKWNELRTLRLMRCLGRLWFAIACRVRHGGRCDSTSSSAGAPLSTTRTVFHYDAVYDYISFFCYFGSLVRCHCSRWWWNLLTFEFEWEIKSGFFIRWLLRWMHGSDSFGFVEGRWNWMSEWETYMSARFIQFECFQKKINPSFNAIYLLLSDWMFQWEAPSVGIRLKCRWQAQSSINHHRSIGVLNRLVTFNGSIQRYRCQRRQPIR